MIGMSSTGSLSVRRAGQWSEQSMGTSCGGLGREPVHCADFVREAWVLAERPEVEAVVLAASQYGFTERPDSFRLGDTHPYPWALALKRLHCQGKQVLRVLSSPSGPLADPQQWVERGLWTWHLKDLPSVDREQLSSLLSDVDQRLREVAKTGQAVLVDPFDSLCRPDGRCTLRMPGPHQLIGQHHERPSAQPRCPPALTTQSARGHDHGQPVQSSRVHIRPRPA
jgi:hypothetical protein